MKKLMYLLVLGTMFVFPACNWIFPTNSADETTEIKASEPIIEQEQIDRNTYGIINDPDGYTNVREEKSSKSDILFKIYNNKRFKVINDNGNWWLIEYNRKQGYMYKDRINIIE